MRYEVEMKFPVADPSALEARLTGLGTTIAAAQSEVDVYFAHPARDYSRTDEALRLRRKGTAYSITYKGPKIDAATKTRREIDLPLATDEEGFKAWFAMLEALGFSIAGEVRKSRRKARVLWQERSVEVSLDAVERLGEFAELELVVDDGSTTGVDGAATDAPRSPSIEAAIQCIASLAAALGLEASERRSYLELLMDKDQ
ncbi:MAG: class IV adenylate cyclase [Planctomycetales bacterium]|nr:class IV adenylate cyclase [Planctomycetales bacterium]